jgi:hypothetical protein
VITLQGSPYDRGFGSLERGGLRDDQDRPVNSASFVPSLAFTRRKEMSAARPSHSRKMARST